MLETWQPAKPPPYFAEHRYHLFKSTPWFHVSQSGYYGTIRDDPRNKALDGGPDQAFCLGLLQGRFWIAGAYMDAEVIIGGLNGPDSDKKTIERRIKDVRRNILEKRPIGVVVQQGATSTLDHGYPLFPCTMPKDQDSWPLAWFMPTFMWPERCENGKILWMARLEKCNIDEQSWWANPAHGPPPPLSSRDFTTKALVDHCGTCDADSPRIFEQGPVCLNQQCQEWWQSGGRNITRRPAQEWTYSDLFLKERFDRAQPIQGLVEGYPALYQSITDFKRDNYDNLLLATKAKPNSQKDIVSLCDALLKGFACSDCGMLNARVRWHEWHCRNASCNFTISAPPPTLTPQFLTSCTIKEMKMKKWAKFNYEKLTGFQGAKQAGSFTAYHYSLSPSCNVSILKPKPDALAVADEFFTKILALANDGRLQLERRQINTPGGISYTNHFNSSFGDIRYVFGVLVPSTPFDDGPPEVKQAVNLINNWLRSYFENGTGDFNQLYFACYLAAGEIRMHDDGESGLGPNVATWTLGGRGTFEVAIKPLWDYGRKMTNRGKPRGEDSWIDHDPLIPGCLEYKYRKEIWEKYLAGRIDHVEWKKLFRDRMSSKQGTHRILSQFPVDHGDVLLMHGDTQLFFDHGAAVAKVMPMRLALTFRTILREMVADSKMAAQSRKIEVSCAYKRGMEADSSGQPGKRRKV